MEGMILSFLFVASVLAANPCDGAKVGYWKNPDGSRGGLVASTAKVSAGVIIGPEAQVCGEAIVSGKTHIFGRAKISGKAKINNAKICQASQINGFDVVDSDYYCQTEDPEPPHPGEAGKKTLLGVDSDQDGVRDDLEIWINERFSNTPSEDKRLVRLEFKDFSRSTLEIMKKSKIKSEVIRLETENSRIGECLRNTGLRGKLLEVYTEFEGNLMNTQERYKTWWEVQKYFSGMGILTKARGAQVCRHK